MHAFDALGSMPVSSTAQRLTRFFAAAAIASLATTCPAQWFLEAPTVSPASRSGAPFSFDAARGHCVLFGGAQPTFGAHADTWTFDGQAWAQQSPAVSPPARGGARLVFDSLRSVTVLFGGISASPIGGQSFNDTWEWDGVTWTQRTTATTPFRSGRNGMAFDPLRGRTVVFGGVPSSMLIGATNQTWEFDGTNWLQRTPATNPGSLDGPAMCFCETLGTCVLFGGVTPVTGAMNSTTWLWNGTTWTAASVLGIPPQPRYQANMVWDSSRGVCVMHGGVDSSGLLLDETWEFDGVAWTLAAPSGPGARRLSSLAFDRLRGTTVLFGGAASLGGGAGTTLNDTWIYGASYSPFGPGCAGSAGTPSLTALAGPRVGQTFVPTLSNLVPIMPLAILALGFSDTVWQGAPLPFDLTSFGIPGCSLLMAADRIDVIAAQNGIGQQFLPIPADPAFVGVYFYQQGFSFEVAGFNAFGGVLSNAARARIGI